MRRLQGVRWSERTPAWQLGGEREEAERAITDEPFGWLQWLRPSVRVGKEKEA
jgi:hypothetical protein